MAGYWQHGHLSPVCGSVSSVRVFLSSEVSYSATRKSVTVPSASVVARGGGSPSVSGPSLKIPGQPGVEYIPRSGGGASGVPIKIIPTIDFSIPRTIKGSVSSLKGGIAGIAATAAMSMALDSIGGFIDENGKPVKKVSDAPSGPWQAFITPGRRKRLVVFILILSMD